MTQVRADVRSSAAGNEPNDRLAARHDAKNDPELSFAYEEALVFPRVYRPLPGAPRVVPPPTAATDTSAADPGTAVDRSAGTNH